MLGFLAACITVLLIPVAVWDVGLWMRHASGQGFGLSSPGACCTAALAVCFACGAGVSVEEFCADQGAAVLAAAEPSLAQRRGVRAQLVEDPRARTSNLMQGILEITKCRGGGGPRVA